MHSTPTSNFRFLTLYLLAFASSRCLASHEGHHESPIRISMEELDQQELVDLSHPLDNSTLYWPGLQFGFQYQNLADSERSDLNKNISYFLKSDAFNMTVHCGTHLDAPKHFSASGWTVEQIPLDRLVGVPVRVIDLSKKVEADRKYTFKKEDFIDASTQKPLVQPKSVVLVYTGISKLYSQGIKQYFGTDEGSKNLSAMQIPGFSKEAALYLTELGIYGVGLDSPSADSSANHYAENSIDPQAHVVLNSNNIYIIENINENLAKLVSWNRPALLTIAPLPIVGGSGSPIRLVARLVDKPCPSANSRALPVAQVAQQGLFAAILLMSIFTLCRARN